ncbi:UNVERIFIED_ORG: hypothetical protein GGI63_003341 [Rhizobium esperanzae]
MSQPASSTAEKSGQCRRLRGDASPQRSILNRAWEVVAITRSSRELAGLFDMDQIAALRLAFIAAIRQQAPVWRGIEWHGE